MYPTVSRLYKCNLEAIFQIQKLFTEFLYELQPSLHIHIIPTWILTAHWMFYCKSSSQDFYMNCSLLFALTLLLPVHYWRLKCVLVKHLLHLSTRFVYIWQLSFPTTTLQQVDSSLSRLCWYGKWQPTVVRSKQNSVCNILLTMRWVGRIHHVSCCLYSALLSTCLPNMRSLMNFPLGNDVCWPDLHNLSDGKQSMNGGMMWLDKMHEKSGPTLLCPPDFPWQSCNGI